MRNFDRENPTPPSPETILLQPGAGAYPIHEEFIGFLGHDNEEEQLDDEQGEQKMRELSQLVQAARFAVESQGGVFNGMERQTVHRIDQEWMGSRVAISVFYVLAYLPTE